MDFGPYNSVSKNDAKAENNEAIPEVPTDIVDNLRKWPVMLDQGTVFDLCEVEEIRRTSPTAWSNSAYIAAYCTAHVFA